MSSTTILTLDAPKAAGTLRPSRRHRQGARGGALSLHADIRKILGDRGNESSQRASGRVRSFRKDRGQLEVASRDPPLLSALPHNHLLPLLVGWRHAADPRLTKEN